MRSKTPVLVLFLALGLVASPVFAHPVPFSYLDLHLPASASGDLDGSLVVHIFDAAHELGVEPPERLLDSSVLASRAPALTALLAQRITIAIDGVVVSPEWSTVDVLAERQSLRLGLRRRVDRAPGTVAVSAALFPYDPNHQDRKSVV